MTQEEKEMIVSIIDDLRATGDVNELEEIRTMFAAAVEATLQRKKGDIKRAEIFEKILETKINRLQNGE